MIDNAKAEAWNLVGGLFWEKGRATARPTEAEIDIFLMGLNPGARVGIVGASTKDLVSNALKRGLTVTVLDFSPRMCSDLSDVLGSEVDIRIQDITGPIPGELKNSYDAVLSDRLINRFTHKEGVKAFSGMLELLHPGGTVRAAIKLGLYPMDERMIEEGRRRGTLSTFYDETSRTINFAAAADVLEHCLLPHGEIERATLLNWYRGRGLESRFEDNDIQNIVLQARAGKLALVPVNVMPFPDAKGVTYYIFEAIPLVTS